MPRVNLPNDFIGADWIIINCPSRDSIPICSSLTNRIETISSSLSSLSACAPVPRFKLYSLNLLFFIIPFFVMNTIYLSIFFVSSSAAVVISSVIPKLESYCFSLILNVPMGI